MPRFSERTAKKTPEAAVSPAGMRIVRLLVGRPPTTVSDLIKATGVTRTAVTEQLNELVAAGFARRTSERLSGRGRPRHLYSATNSALTWLFAGNQRLLVPAIWEAITDLGGSELTRKIVKRVSRKMANHYKRRITAKTPRQRMVQLSRLLREEGELVEIEKDGNGRFVMRRRSCGFFSMYEHTGMVCGVDQAMLNLIVGARVRRVTCRHDGDPCCSFALESTNGK
jgi:predicted ArsR family transcriptional regulator